MKIDMEPTTIVTKNGKRIDFCSDEIAFMREQAVAQNGDRLSYADIARTLNSRYKEHNEGRRTRQSVYEFMTADPDAPVLERIAIPRDLLQRLKATGQKLETVVNDALKERLCETSTPPAEPEGAPSAAGSSQSPQTSSTDTGTVFSRNQKKKSGKAAGQRS